MQSWGSASRFDVRDTGKEPTKSGVTGILAAAMGIDRGNWSDLEPLAALRLTVRHDRPGALRRDYQTAGGARGDKIVRADGSLSEDGNVSHRYYLADAAFLALVESESRSLLERLHTALQAPAWPLFLGRRSYVPSEPMWFTDGVQDDSADQIVRRWPWIAALRDWETPPMELLVSYESASNSGTLRMDQPLSSFADRRFGARFVQSEWVPFPGNPDNAAA